MLLWCIDIRTSISSDIWQHGDVKVTKEFPSNSLIRTEKWRRIDYRRHRDASSMGISLKWNAIKSTRITRKVPIGDYHRRLVGTHASRSTWPDNASRSRGNHAKNIVICAVFRLSCHVSCDNREPIFEKFTGRRPRIPTCNTRTTKLISIFKREIALQAFFKDYINRNIDYT